MDPNHTWEDIAGEYQTQRDQLRAEVDRLNELLRAQRDLVFAHVEACSAIEERHPTDDMEDTLAYIVDRDKADEDLWRAFGFLAAEPTPTSH